MMTRRSATTGRRRRPSSSLRPAPQRYPIGHSIIAALLALPLLLVLGLAACGGAASPPTPVPTPGPSPTVTVPFEMPVTVSLVGRFRPQELALLDEQIARFEAANPGIVVEIAEIGKRADSSRQALEEALAGGDRPLDVLVLDDAWLPDFAAQGWLMPLGGYVGAEEVGLGAFFPGAVDACQFEGEMWALPWIAEGGLLFYRSDLLTDYGLGVPATWPEVQATALELRRQAGLPQGYVWQGAAYESLTCNTLEFLWAFGGQVLDEEGRVVFDSPENRAALQQMLDLVASGASPEDIAAYREGTALKSFAAGDSAMMRNWPYAWDRLQATGPAVQGGLGAVPLPASCLLGRVLALSADSMVPEQSFRLLQFLVGEQQQLELARELGRPPALRQVYEDPQLLADRPFFGTLRPVLDRARPRPRSAAYAQISEAIYEEVNRMLAGEQGAEDTAVRVQQRLEAVLAAGLP